MTPQEAQTLQRFLDQLVNAGAARKDAEAARLIDAALQRQPDAAYLLVQRALLLEQALETARSALAEREERFLDPANAWGNSVAAPVARAAAPVYAPAQAVPAAPAASSWLAGGGGSMLGTIAATAAGVAGGAFLYQGIEHMLHGRDGGQREGGSHAFTDTSTLADNASFSGSGLDDLGPSDDSSF